MDTWVHQQLRAMYRRRVAAWCLVLGCAVLFALVQSRYIKNFASGPFDVGQAELDAIGDVSTTPYYFVRVTGSKAIETGIQQITTRKRAGVETGRSVSAAYYVLVVGDRLLVVKRAEGTPTTVQGELVAMPAELDRHLFGTPQMQARLKQLAADARPGTPEELATFIASEIPKWQAMAKIAGITGE